MRLGATERIAALAEASDMVAGDLQQKLLNDPGALTIDELFRIADALGTTLVGLMSAGEAS